MSKSRQLTIKQAILLAAKELEKGNFSKARHIYNAILQQQPNHPIAKEGLRKLYNILGLTLHKLGKLAEAVQSYNKAIQLKPDFVEAYSNRGNTLQEQGKFKEAVESFNKAIQLKPDFVEAYYNRGNALKLQSRLHEAIQSLDKAIQLKPDFIEAHCNRGSILQVQGRFQEAIESFSKAIQLKPDFAEVYYNLSKIKTHYEYDEMIRNMESLYHRKDISPQQREYLAFALGKAFEDLKEHNKSFNYILEGNRIKRGTYDYKTEIDVERFNKLKEVFSSTFFSSHTKTGNPDETPIFILGMPRSGTTLVEQILASHSQVHGAGELLNLFKIANGIHTYQKKEEFPACMLHLNDEGFITLGSSYLQGLRKHSTSKRFITDKMPHNFRLIGLIKVILPKAKVIHCMRNPMDNCLSVFKNRFSQANHYAYNLKELGEFYYHYLDLMNHWRATIPHFIYDISYEALVLDQEQETKKLLNYCQLPWEETCLSFYKTERPIATSSYTQVRRPMYSDSVNLWMKYESELEPLKKALNK